MSVEVQMALPLDLKEARPAKTIRRRVHRVRLEPNGLGFYVFRARSFTRRRGWVYRCGVNPTSGEVWCTCRDFRYRKRWQHPSYSYGSVCKHLERAIKTVRRVERHGHAMPMAA